MLMDFQRAPASSKLTVKRLAQSTRSSREYVPSTTSILMLAESYCPVYAARNASLAALTLVVSIMKNIDGALVL